MQSHGYYSDSPARVQTERNRVAMNRVFQPKPTSLVVVLVAAAVAVDLTFPRVANGVFVAGAPSNPKLWPL